LILGGKQPLLHLLIIITLIFSSDLALAIIDDYKPVFIPSCHPDQTFIILRSFTLNGEKKLLIVDPASLETTIKAAEGFLQPCNINQIKKLAKSTYYKAIKHYNSPPYLLQNYGITRLKGPGVFLTIDLCPTNKVFEKDFFISLINLSLAQERKIPIAIAVSGLWIKKRQEDFDWLIKQTKHLDITWINHSFSHPYDPQQKDLNKNFLNQEGIDFISEVLLLEQQLIRAGLTPSIFFRFPGLVSNAAQIKELEKLGLIAVGSDAWLAKGQKAKEGTIILVHGNSNERQGIILMTRLLPHFNLLSLQSFLLK
jgi:hypothetical protein